MKSNQMEANDYGFKRRLTLLLMFPSVELKPRKFSKERKGVSQLINDLIRKLKQTQSSIPIVPFYLHLTRDVHRRKFKTSLPFEFEEENFVWKVVKAN